ncbi:MAG: hypothetical protein COV98_01345 [Candidatus Altarchaeum sp. CG12_big_fil_rev_8_21_14_0_65_33_22]|nr:MAG: hypothetical protein AUK59_06535 [Candidatus Altarchaeum sp. CG2_30_32_3053]PIN67846.1 MAG: hypothetical protein COV98_01345 [Candidatus Altarchaeum sp. CG12_big_fil_rev_8_21_14_0_65_33_22]PIV27395.1 MAG: hypothetical protein COS36_05920 [Candidatus Altarchaeum sp. CG03_land_8_20_14_0_80_32_618]PIZ31130.1 MAG: hypothetical protein COY41_02990 [Candidatus Altarchaeum sp. CG_4_10_14_0_8_um_filter_32_851]PJC15501.1 MAG: hypothetical protein CO063_01165 [Candidatus Altarchaeum sp. CG_4_9_14
MIIKILNLDKFPQNQNLINNCVDGNEDIIKMLLKMLLKIILLRWKSMVSNINIITAEKLNHALSRLTISLNIILKYQNLLMKK